MTIRMNRMRAISQTAGVLLAASGALAQMTDTERVIEYEKLNEAMTNAAEAVVAPIRESNIGQRFEELIEIARAEQIDKEALIDALGALRIELEKFASALDQEPLWEAQALIWETIDRIRVYVATGPTGVANDELDRQLAEMDRQLEELAYMIDRETDPRREERLKALFHHQLRMRRLKETALTIDTSDPSVAIWLGISNALDKISTQLTTTAFTLEEARYMLNGVGERLALHLETLDALKGREHVAQAISSVGATSSELATAMNDLVLVAQQATELDVVLADVTSSLVLQTERAGQDVPDQSVINTSLPSIDVDAELERFRRKREQEDLPGDGEKSGSNGRRASNS